MYIMQKGGDGGGGGGEGREEGRERGREGRPCRRRQKRENTQCILIRIWCR